MTDINSGLEAITFDRAKATARHIMLPGKKMNSPIIILLIALVMLTGCSDNEGSARNNSRLVGNPLIEGMSALDLRNKTMVLKSGEEIRYTTSVPADYDANTPTPLIVALHYGGEVTPHYSRGIVTALILPGLRELNAIVVAPDSIAGRWTNEKNEKMVLELMDAIGQQYNIDKHKILLTGFSMGGHGTWYIGSRNQERFSAMIPISGSPKVENDVVWTTPIHVIHSRADKVVPIKAVEDYVAAQKEQGNQQIVFTAIDDVPHFQTGRFSVPLRDAVPWVQEIWAGGKSEK